MNLFSKTREIVVSGRFKGTSSVVPSAPLTKFERRCQILSESYTHFMEDGEKLLAADVLALLKSVLDDEIKSLTATYPPKE